MTNPLSDRAKAAIKGAVAKQGRHRGQLLRRCPPMGTDAAVAWQALEANANPYKMSIGRMLWMTPAERELFNEVDLHITQNGLDVRGLDRDRVALEQMGAW